MYPFDRCVAVGRCRSRYERERRCDRWAKHSRAGWVKLVRDWRASGEAADTFAAKRGIKPKTLQWWAWNLGSAQLEPMRPLEVIEIVHAVAPPAERFEVHLANGRCVGVPPTFDAEALGRLLGVVEAAR